MAGQTYVSSQAGTQTYISTVAPSSGGGGITNSAGNNVIMKSNGTNAVASQITDDGTQVTVAQKIKADDNVYILQSAAADADIANYGQLWVRSSDGNLMFTNASGTDTDLLASGGGGASSPLVLTASSASELPLEIEAASGQTANLFEINSSAGSGGDVLKVAASGEVTFSNNVMPDTDNVYELGSLTMSWDNLYLGNAGTIRIGGDTRLIGTDGVNGGLRIYVDNGPKICFQTPNESFHLSDGWQVGFSSDTSLNTTDVPDAGIGRVGASVLRASNGSTGVGSIIGGRRAVALTINTTLDAVDSGTVYTNEGAGVARSHTLPTAVAGLSYIFYVQEAQDFEINAAAGDTIRINGTESAVAGDATSATVGSAMRLTAINATEWVAETVTGSWTVT